LSNGEPFYALGFRIGDISYVSDVSKLPAKAKNIIKNSKIVLMDALRSKSFFNLGAKHQSHFSFDQSIEAINELCAPGGIGLFTGLTHDLDHDEINDWIKSQHSGTANVKVMCAYDGMKISTT
jgi:phosphoribosyl 1,2-cyclic phosphodiesterase